MTTHATETVSLIQDVETEHCYYQVERGEDDFYLCDADGDKVTIANWILLDTLGTIPADDADAFFALIERTAKRVETTG